MLRLNLSNEPRWLDLAPGVRIQLRPVDVELVAEAQADPAFRASLGADDLPEDEIALLAMDPSHKARVGFALGLALAKRAITAWEGIEDEKGRVIAKPFEAGIEALLRIPAVFRIYQERYMAPAMTLVAEGNGSGRAPSGISGAARTTAPRARAAAKPARKPRTRH